MKKLLLIFGLSAILIGAKAQTGTIVDNGPYFTVNYPSGDTVSVGKDNIVLVKPNGGEVFIMTSHQWRSDRVTRIIHLDPDDFGYASTSTLREYLAAIAFRAYREVYVYDGGNLDSVKYYYGSQLQYSIDYGYTGTVVTSKTIVTQ